MVERIIGHARVYVPQGEWSYIIYTHHPTKPMFSYAQKLEHPLRIGDGTTNQGGWIDVQNITEDVLKNPGRLM